MSRHSRIASGLLAMAALALPLGCGSDDGLGTRYPVTGKVTYNGQLLKKGRIDFVPETPDGRGATGEIIDGEIRNVSTTGSDSGVLPGKYKVAIQALEDIDLSKTQSKYNAAPDQVVMAKEAAKAKSLIPKRYANAID